MTTSPNTPETEDGWALGPCERWAVIGYSALMGVARYEAGLVTKVTAQRVYAKAHYSGQHQRDLAMPMPDEATARRVGAQIQSAYAEAERRKRAANDYYKTETEKLLSPFKQVTHD
jgi:hypothetical protein